MPTIINFLSQDRHDVGESLELEEASDFNYGWDDLTVTILGLEQANTCSTHLGIIGYRNGTVCTHTKYIQNREYQEDNKEGFRPMISKIADLTNTQLVVIGKIC